MMIAENNQPTPQLGEYLTRGAACILVLAYEQVATIVLQVAKPYVDYQLPAIALAVVLAIIMRLFGKRDVIRDLCEICWLDVGIQVIGALVARTHGQLFLYAALANSIFYLKWARIFWPARHDDGSWASWPIFGLIGLIQRKQYPNPLTFLQTASAYFAMLLCLGAGYLHQMFAIKAGSLVPLCVIVTIVLVYARTLIANVEAQQAELLATTAALATAREQARQADIMAQLNAELALQTVALAQTAAELEEKNAALDELNKKVIVFNEDLHLANDQLRFHNKMVSQANHDIAPLLTFLHAYLQDLSATSLDDTQRNYLTQITYIASTTGDLLAQNIGTRRHPDLEKKSGFSACNLDDIMATYQAPLDNLAQQHGSFFKVNLPTSINVWSNDDHLRRIIINLVRNAIIHNPPGTHVRMFVTTKGTAYTVRILDTGTGIPEAGGANPAANFKALVERVKNRSDAPSETASGEASHGIGLQSVADLSNTLEMPIALYTRFKLGAIFQFRLGHAV